MSELNGGPARGVFHRGRGWRGQRPPHFGDGRGLTQGGRPDFPPRFHMGGGPGDWGAPVYRPPPLYSPSYHPGARPRPPFPRPGGPHQRQFRPPSQWHQNKLPPPGQTWCAQGQNFDGNKRKKIDKRELPENNKFYCDICDRGFKTKELHTAHVDSHTKCKVEGCAYTAAPKLVQLHFNLQHKTGLAKKIWQLESKEDLEKWRAERKKNFPTAANINRKLVQQADRIARGEVLETKTFGKFRSKGRGRGQGRGRGHGRGRGRSTDHVSHDITAHKRSHDQSVPVATSPPKKPKTDVMGQVSTEEKQSHPEGDPLSLVLPAGTTLDSDDEADARGHESHDNKMAASQPRVCAAGALGSLISSYGSDSGEEPTEGPVAKETNKQDRDKGEDVELAQENRKWTNSSGRQKPHRKRNRRGKSSNDVQSVPRKSTLLEKLLAPEIRHERNIILQCVKYIVKKGFFGAGAKSQTQENSNKGKQLNSQEMFNDEIWENGL